MDFRGCTKNMNTALQGTGNLNHASKIRVVLVLDDSIY